MDVELEALLTFILGSVFFTTYVAVLEHRGGRSEKSRRDM